MTQDSICHFESRCLHRLMKPCLCHDLLFALMCYRCHVPVRTKGHVYCGSIKEEESPAVNWWKIIVHFKKNVCNTCHYCPMWRRSVSPTLMIQIVRSMLTCTESHSSVLDTSYEKSVYDWGAQNGPKMACWWPEQKWRISVVANVSSR